MPAYRVPQHIYTAVLPSSKDKLAVWMKHDDIWILPNHLLQLAPNAWLAGLVQMDRGAVAAINVSLNVAYDHLAQCEGNRQAHRISAEFAGADRTLGHLQFLVGEFDKSKRTLLTLTSHPRASISVKLSALDTLARVHLALGELDQCENAVGEINKHICWSSGSCLYISGASSGPCARTVIG